MTRWLLPVLALWLPMLAAPLGAQAPLEFAREDPTKIQTAETCGECHISEYEVWKRTPHATGFKDLHRKKTAEAITERMGFRLMKRDSSCLLCHYTPTVQGEQLRAVSGVSCESCHGAGEDWIDIHNDYGGKGFDHTNETLEHRQARIAQSRDAGMRRPTDLYEVASSCYGCHTVPNERLVNVGKHSIGSPSFELVAWSQGDIRHNFLESFKNGDGTDNVESSAERRRMMYIAGRALELEHALRGVAAATEKGAYLKAMQRRVRDAVTEVRGIATQATLPEMDEAVELVRETGVKLGNRDALMQAADRVGQATKRLLAGHDGTLLASLDPLVSGTVEAADLIDELEDDDVELAATETIPADGDSKTAAATAPSGTAGDPAGAGDPTQAARAAAAIEAIPAVGEKRTRIRPRSEFATLSGDTCQKCHGDQNAWWFNDPHYAAIEPFLEKNRKNVQIARLYDISPSRMARGNSLCMDCHGTIITGRETREVQDGVSCQSCHGPAKEFLEPHQEGDKSLGLERPGYVNALNLGMVELKNLTTRAATCTGCHYITDQRLISSGHPSGVDFDYASGMTKIRHWSSPQVGAPALNAVFSSQLAARGSVPKVRLARLAAAAPRAATAGAAGIVGEPGARGGDIATTADDGEIVYRPRQPPRSRPVDRRSLPATGSRLTTELPPFPEIDDGTAIEDILRLLRERLELLYRTIRKEP